MRKHFLGVGNNSYDLDSSGLRPLRFAESDVLNVARALREHLGFNTQTLIGRHATKSAVEAALTCGRVNGVPVSPDDFFVLMFAVHGSVTNFDGNYYLHLHGATLEHAAGSIAASYLSQLLHGTAFKAQHVLTIYDACRSLTVQLPNSRGTMPADHECLSRDVSAVRCHHDRTVATLYGCAQNEVSYEDPDTLRSGLLSYHLAEAAADPAVLSAWDWVFTATRKTVAWSRANQGAKVQRPWQSGADHLQPVVLRDRPRPAPEPVLEPTLAPVVVPDPAPTTPPAAAVISVAQASLTVEQAMRLAEARLRQQREQAAEAERRRERRQEEADKAERRQASARLAELLAADRLAEARRACSELLARWPGDQEALSAKQFLDDLLEPVNSVGMKFVEIEPGEFLMGSPAGEAERKDHEAQHKVRLTKAFLMATTPVTQAQWKAVMGSNPSYFQGDTLPVEQVSWDDAAEFCKKLSRKESKTYRLPAEAEWEYACRAGTNTPFHTGETISTDQVNYDGNYTYGNGRKGVYREKATPVGSFKPNAWGLYDMHGNVDEWCADFYAPYPAGPVTDPTGPTAPPQNNSRVLRGGSWSDLPGSCRSASRARYAPVYQSHVIGFRVVLDFRC